MVGKGVEREGAREDEQQAAEGELGEAEGARKVLLERVIGGAVLGPLGRNVDFEEGAD